jgi:methionyl-tRNA formyltransferase
VHNLVRAVAPPYPGAFTDVGGHRVRVLATRRLADDATLPRPAQAGLFSHAGALYLMAGDGRMLAVAAADCDGVPLTAARLDALAVPTAGT